MQGQEIAGAVALAPERGGVDDEQIFEDHAQPGVPVVGAVGAFQKFFDAGDVGGVGVAAGFGANRPVHPLDLVFSRLDDEAQQVVGVGERAEVGEGDGLIPSRARGKVVAGGEIPLAARDVAWGAGVDGVGGAEPVVGRLGARAGAGGKFRRRKGPVEARH